MKQVSVTELKSRLSHYLRAVKRGEQIEVVERAIPIARIEGVDAKRASPDGHLRVLMDQGVVSAPRRRAPRGGLLASPVPCKGDPVAALVADRDGR